ncbi:hypothetical protein ACMA1I_02280 [Pontibacter sp. 13R65]
MLSTIILVSSMMIYFFTRVLTAPPRPEPDSYLANDDEPGREPAPVKK